MGMISYFLKDKNGVRLSKIKKIMNESTHCGKYWGVKTKLKFFPIKLSQIMEGNETNFYYPKLGYGERHNHDGAYNIRRFIIKGDDLIKNGKL